MLAKDIGVPLGCISEWLLGWRSTPRAETLLELIGWGFKKDPKKFGKFIASLGVEKQ